MWQILWMLGFIPDWIFQAILIVGLLAVFASYFLKFIPAVFVYSKSLKVTGVILVIIGVWFNGQMSADAKWRSAVADLQSKVAESERQAKEANAQIEYVYVDRVKVVEKLRYQVIGTIRDMSNELDANCTISPKAVEILNRSADALKQDDQK
jgi:hypothetical protein